MADRIYVRPLEAGLYQWREVSAHGTFRSEAVYAGDVNLLKENIDGRAVCLLLDGRQVVTQRLPATIKDRRQLLKVLPYEVEENIVDPIEDLHFAYGPVAQGEISLAYIEADWLERQVADFVALGSDVQRCLVDYLLLPRDPEGITLLLEDGRLYAHTGPGVGFVVEEALAPLYLEALAKASEIAVLRLYGESDEAIDRLREILPSAWGDNLDISIDTVAASFWDVIDPAQDPVFDFRTGRLSRKLPLTRWAQEWKLPLAALAAAFVVAIGATWIGQLRAEQERRAIVARTDAIFREAVPTGNITNPERQLRTLLGDSGGGGVTSNAVTLLAGVAPAVSNFKEVTIKNLRYSADNGQLQLNIEADSFNTFESLRSKIAEAGYEVEIRSANVFGDVHQAQLRISGARS